MEKKSVFTLFILAIFIATGYSTDTSQNPGGNSNAIGVNEIKNGTDTTTTLNQNDTTTSSTIPPTTSTTSPNTTTPPAPKPPTPTPKPPTPTPKPPTPTPITSTLTPQPVPSTTSLPPTTVAPPKPDRSFDLPSFVGGIILALGVLAIGYVVYKFYRARTDPNYRTL